MEKDATKKNISHQDAAGISTGELHHLSSAGSVLVGNKNVHFSSKTNEWSTPQDFFDELNKEFNFNLDPCATSQNHKCKLYYSSGGLEKTWDNFRVFCNPPYGREIGKWVKKASEARGGIVVMLIPARTDTTYFHKYIYHKTKIRFLKGRLKFGGKSSAPFPSMVVIFKDYGKN
jgi:site-specific DNA-methyltransferase (adenine-specific)